ncbi:hypothetical protein BASA81_007856 [Batrachochytrium salamandrivorans]|nr:hypothetical protein BASA81_007856 [Batrachochytrium salamandrivorans]
MVSNKVTGLVGVIVAVALYSVFLLSSSASLESPKFTPAVPVTVDEPVAQPPPTTMITTTTTTMTSQPLSSSWKWTKPERNLIFVKIPKTGSTTMFELFSRLAEHTKGWTLARPLNNASELSTCDSAYYGKRNWEQMVQGNGGRIDLFADHACYHPEYMAQPRYWSLNKPPTPITVMRKPVDQFTSKYRFTQACCEEGRLDWCKTFCRSSGNYSLTRYMISACTSGTCSEQKRYMGLKQPSEKRIIDSFFLVMIMERFEESLALLGLKLGLPIRALPFLQENSNTRVQRPVYTKSEVERIEYRARRDVTLYALAVKKFNAVLAALTQKERVEYEHILSTLRFANAKANAKCGPQCAHEKSTAPMTMSQAGTKWTRTRTIRTTNRMNK